MSFGFSMSDEIEELDSSELGTLSYWDDVYNTEVKNYEKTGDIGEVWFGEESLTRVIKWIRQCDPVKSDDFIIDIGCGNGITLLELAREGFINLVGIDYSEPAVKLAISICEKEFPNLNFEVCDIISNDLSNYEKKFKIVHDKGTYDAISLHPEDPKTKRAIYIQKVEQILSDDGFFIITSCNWTEDELCNHFIRTFSLKKIIPTPQFKFGGKVGSIITSAVFEKLKTKQE